MEVLSFHIQTFFQNRNRRWLFLVVAVAATHLMLQSVLLPYGNALRSLLPNDVDLEENNDGSFLGMQSSAKSIMARNPLTVNVSESPEVNLNHVTELFGDEMKRNFTSSIEVLEVTGIMEIEDATGQNDVEVTQSIESQPVKFNDSYIPENVVDGLDLEQTLVKNDSYVPEIDDRDIEHGVMLEQTVVKNDSLLSDGTHTGFLKDLLLNGTDSVSSNARQSTQSAIRNASMVVSSTVKKKYRCDIPPNSVTTIEEMEKILVRHRASSRAMRPRWSSVRDKELLAAKLQIQNAPATEEDKELYAPLFRNVSMFRRSYELMERTLKVYVYKEGEKPVFHSPILKGLYASEGWFMKLMEGNKQFIVKDPRRAHLYYMPFSSRMLEYTVYVRNSHNRTNLRQYLKQYTDKISAKYPFFNRTGGADHFLVACHDWAPYETRLHMERCIKALCNADVTQAFKIGRDVSLPETYVRSARNPLRDLGGKPASKRNILAFYAGNLHGYLRPILLEHWKDKDPNMKIFGPMPPGVASKMNYIQHMKSSKYCICPKGYEVNSPRVVEAIFYECVPVIISDNFVPPFFEVLDWKAFSLILAEKDIPNLKNILLSITEERYREMQMGVKKVQQHFLWHAKPLKYDLFHMTLHSIWHNRVFQVKAR